MNLSWLTNGYKVRVIKQREQQVLSPPVAVPGAHRKETRFARLVAVLQEHGAKTLLLRIGHASQNALKGRDNELLICSIDQGSSQNLCLSKTCFAIGHRQCLLRHHGRPS